MTTLHDPAVSTVVVKGRALDLTGNVNAGNFTTDSDARLKKDVETVENAMSTISQIRPVFYNWIDTNRQPVNPGHREIGFIAQELEEVLPNVVKTGNDEMNTKHVAYDRLVSLLVGAVKELSSDISTLKGNAEN
jgi:hypothetical protein